MTAADEITKKKNRTVLDQHGQNYELTGRVGEGGQGVVCTTNYPNVLVKIARASSVEKQKEWIYRIENLMRQPLEGLPIAHPLALIVQPQPGYVMELMDGLVSLAELMQKAEESLMSEGGLDGYLQTGGLKRRFKLLARLARVLAELHGRGLAFGDLAPANIFVSKSIQYSEVWLIDADNITSQSLDYQQGVFTPDYGAPEIVKAESGINTLTDSWSFSVLAYRCITLAHPLKGDYVLEGDPALEEASQRGELPWVDHLLDSSNARSFGIPSEITLNTSLRNLFELSFNAGMTAPSERPSLSAWAESLEEAAERCNQCATCSSTFLYKTNRLCPFCDSIQDKDCSLLLQEYYYMPPALLRKNLSEDVPDELIHKECWTRTGKAMVLTSEPIQLKELPIGTSMYAEASPFCILKLELDGLWIEPCGNAQISLQRALEDKDVKVLRKQRLKTESRLGTACWLHLGDREEEHVVWKLTW